MITVSHADERDRNDWDSFVDAHDRAEAYHAYQWREVYEGVFGQRCIYLLARHADGSPCGVLPLVQLKSLLFGNFLVSLPCFSYCGTLAESEEARRELVRAAWSAATTLGARHVELRHRDDVSLDLPYRSDKVGMRLSLPETSDELWQRFPAKLRAQIRRPGKEGAVCVDGGLELLDEFYAVFSRNMRDLGTPVYPKKLFRAISDGFPDATRFFIVRLQDQPVAAGFTLGFRKCLEIPNASSLRQFNRYSVNMLLYWSVLQYAIQQGYTVFDFGRSTEGSGPHRFKRQWGAEPQELHWHYCLAEGAELPRLNPGNPKFKLATRVWRQLPLGVANRLGPRVVRNLP